MPSLHDFIPIRHGEIEAELKHLMARLRVLQSEHEDLRRAAKSVGIPLPDSSAPGQLRLDGLGSPDTARRGPSEATIKGAVVTALREAGHGMTALELLPKINEQLGVEYPRSSLSPQLSRLKAEGQLRLDGNVWSIGDGADGPTDYDRYVRLLVEGRPRLSDRWSSVLNYIADQYPQVVSTGSMVEYGSLMDLGFTRHQLRATLYGWRNRGYIEAIADGQHRITQTGMQALGRWRPSEPETQEGPTAGSDPL